MKNIKIAFFDIDGTLIDMNTKVITKKNPIPAWDVHTIIENAKSIKRPVCVASVDRLGANGRDQDLVDYFEISNEPVVVVEDFESLANEDIYQMMMGCYEEEYARILNNVNGARITAWWNRAADIIPADGGKGLGVEKVLDYFQLSKEEAIAFGDGTNDIEMLQAVGLGVAMGNATDDVKAAADDICGSVAEDGIYHYCKEHHLI